MRTFRHEQASVRVVFARGAVNDVAAEAAALPARAIVLISDEIAANVADAIGRALGDRLADRIPEVVQHVPVDVAEAATERARRVGADLLLCVGGGSATGLAKAIARVSGTPILAVPTTYAGSEMTPIWGLTGPSGKVTGRDPRVQPRIVVYDPELTVTMPAALTASSGMNAIAHCVEALYAPDVSPLTALAAEDGLRTLATGLPHCVEHPEDIDGRAEVLYGAWLAGLSLGSTTMGLHHKLCHVLGGRYNLPHAQTHAAVLPYATAYSRQAAAPQLRRVAQALGADDAAAGLWDLADRLGLSTALAALGLPPDGIDTVVEAVMASPPTNPRPMERKALQSLLRSALQGTRP